MKQGSSSAVRDEKALLGGVLQPVLRSCIRPNVVTSTAAKTLVATSSWHCFSKNPLSQRRQARTKGPPVQRSRAGGWESLSPFRRKASVRPAVGILAHRPAWAARPSPLLSTSFCMFFRSYSSICAICSSVFLLCHHCCY